MNNNVSRELMGLLERQEWLDPPAEALQQAVQKTYDAAGPAGQKAQNFLYGTWLGHQLHPVLTDVPIGAWMMAAVLDALEAMSGRRGRRFRAGADAAVAVGLVGAVGAAVTGLTDWRHVDGNRARRVGMAHALLNLVATLLYAASFFLRRGRKRAAGRNAAWAGFAVSMASAYLGGDLVGEQQIGVNRTAGLKLPEEFAPVLTASLLEDGKLQRAWAGNVPVLVVRRGERIYALVETCAHLGGPLSEGKLKKDDNSVVCPWHGSRYALEDGRVLDGPSAYPQPCLETRVRNGQVEVRAAQSRQPSQTSASGGNDQKEPAYESPQSQSAIRPDQTNRVGVERG
ncbi:MAG: DUF2231 domain-containing protein [Anaerolineales bacterium]